MIIQNGPAPVNTKALASPKKENEEPPAYVENPSSPGASGSVSRRLTRGGPPPAVPPKQAPYCPESKLSTDTTATVSQMHMHCGREPITGTFYIDPKFPSYGFTPDPHHDRHKHHKKNPPDASFRTKKAPINMELATTGEQTEAKPKAKVLVATHSGNITIKLLSTPLSAPRLGLEVLTRKGDIVLMLPNDFFGCLELQTRKGTIQYLPALAASMRTAKKTSDEALIMVGQPTSNKEIDHVQLTTSHGKVIVGISGLDKYDQPSGGFWKKWMGKEKE